MYAEREEGRYAAIDDDEKAYTVVVTSRVSPEGVVIVKNYRLSDGRQLNRVGDGEFMIVGEGVTLYSKAP